MSESHARRFAVTAESIRQSDWEAELAKAEQPDCEHYYPVLFARASELRKEGRDGEAQVFELFGTVAALHGDYSKRQPYEFEMSRTDGPRFGQDDLGLLRAVLHEIRDPEFRAKAADILWEMGKGGRNLDLAQIAVEAFLISADQLEDADMWPPFVERIERALQLAARVQRGKELHLRVIAAIGAKCAKHAPNLSSGLLCSNLMALLLAYDLGDAVKYAALSSQLAEANESAGNWRFAHKYWTRAAEWYWRAKDEATAREATRRAGEAHVSLAEDNMRGPKADAGFAAHWIGVGRQELERSGAPTSRLEELHRRMLELQAQHAQTLRPIDLPEHVIQGANDAVRKTALEARAFVSGLDLPHALFRLATGFEITDTSALRREVEASAKQFIFTTIIGESVVSADGRTLASAPPLGTVPEEEREAAFEREMWKRAKEWDWWFRAAAMIAPAREEIYEAHRPSLIDLAFLVTGNPAVPPGRERLFARGVLAGFHEDWTVALHLLVPQIENALRFVLTRHGVITSAIKADRTQPELSLDWLLTREKTRELLGAGMVFDLRGLLTSKFGANLRNEIAHGLAEEGAFHSPYSECVWWLALRWLFLPTLWQH